MATLKGSRVVAACYAFLISVSHTFHALRANHFVVSVTSSVAVYWVESAPWGTVEFVVFRFYPIEEYIVLLLKIYYNVTFIFWTEFFHVWLIALLNLCDVRSYAWSGYFSRLGIVSSILVPVCLLLEVVWFKYASMKSNIWCLEL